MEETISACSRHNWRGPAYPPRYALPRFGKSGSTPTVKRTNPDCIIWLTAYEVNSPEYAGSALLREVDWLMNEAGDIKRTTAMRNLVGNETRLITCLANWNKQDPAEIVPTALKENVGLYGFTKPVVGPMMKPVDYYLSNPVDSLDGDERNIAVLARTFNNLPPGYVKK